MSEGPVRRTAPIQASAVVGLSRLMDHDHVETLARINAHQRALIAPRVAEFHGHLAGQSKENLFAEFDDLAEAVQCAVEIQRGMGKRNASVPRQKRVEFRFGVAYGELITDGEWVYGDGVEEAARVEAAAEPGGVCLTESAVEEVRGAIGFPFEAGEDGVYRVPSEVLVPPPEDVSSVPRPTLQTRGGASAKRQARRQARARKRRLVWSAGAAGLLIVVAGGVVSVIDWGDSADPSAPAQSNVARASLQSTVATAPARPARELDAVEAMSARPNGSSKRWSAATNWPRRARPRAPPRGMPAGSIPRRSRPSTEGSSRPRSATSGPPMWGSRRHSAHWPHSSPERAGTSRPRRSIAGR